MTFCGNKLFYTSELIDVKDLTTTPGANLKQYGTVDYPQAAAITTNQPIRCE